MIERLGTLVGAYILVTERKKERKEKRREKKRKKKGRKERKVFKLLGTE